MIERFLNIQYELGKGSWTGADCWGLIELYYREEKGVTLINRDSYKPGATALMKGFEGYIKDGCQWEYTDTPLTDDIVFFNVGRRKPGHVGLIINDLVLHTEQGTGVLLQQEKMIPYERFGYMRYTG